MEYIIAQALFDLATFEARIDWVGTAVFTALVWGPVALYVINKNK